MEFPKKKTSTKMYTPYAKLTETQIFRELKSSLIQLKTSLIQFESSLIQFESSLIQIRELFNSIRELSVYA